MPAKTLIGNTSYDVLKHITQVVLPGIGTLYFTLSGIWDLPNGEKVIGTIAAITVFLGVFLGISSKKYKESDDRFAGEIEVERGEERDLYSLNLNTAPEDLHPGDEVTFKVV